MAAAVRKIPLRKCTGCGEMKPKKELLRVLLEPDGTLSVDDTGKKNGRGAYLCRKSDCLKQAIKTKGLQKSLKCNIPDEIINTLQDKYEWE